jgi:hypothetical protein
MVHFVLNWHVNSIVNCTDCILPFLFFPENLFIANYLYLLVLPYVLFENWPYSKVENKPSA